MAFVPESSPIRCFCVSRKPNETAAPAGQRSCREGIRFQAIFKENCMKESHKCGFRTGVESHSMFLRFAKTEWDRRPGRTAKLPRGDPVSGNFQRKLHERKPQMWLSYRSRVPFDVFAFRENRMGPPPGGTAKLPRGVLASGNLLQID